MDYKSVLIAAIFGGVIGMAASQFLTEQKLAGLRAELEQRPPVVVIDMMEMALNAVEPGANQDEIDRHFKQSREAIVRLQEAGYLVLARESIVAAPKDLFVTGEGLQGISAQSTEDE